MEEATAQAPDSMRDGDARDAVNARFDGRLAQGELLLIARLKRDANAQRDLEALLRYMAQPPKPIDLETNPVIPFGKIPSVHFARLLVLPESDGPQGQRKVLASPIPAQLLFATDFDGSLADHLSDLVETAADGLDTVFAYCEGWTRLGGRDRAGRLAVFSDFVARHAAPANTFYSGTVKRSVRQVCREARLRLFIDTLLDDRVKGGKVSTKPEDLHRYVRQEVFRNPHFAWAQERPGPLPRRAPRFVTAHPNLVQGAVAAVALGALIFLLSRVMPWPWALRIAGAIVAASLAASAYLFYLSATDPVIIPLDDGHTQTVSEVEDRVIQNQITTVSYIKKPLWFRRRVLQLVLATVNLAARLTETQGSLSGISSIHFARWVIIDNHQRLLFFSNFDGSWESYLGDFVDKAFKGLTGIWSNTMGFPRTIGLRGAGALDEQRFKALARSSQVVTHFWYSAYKNLTVQDINNNSRLRLRLYQDLDSTEACEWLRMSTPRDGAATFEKAPALTEPSPTVEVNDVQGFVVRSFSTLHAAAYLPVSFENHDAARRWLRDLLPRLTLADKTTAVVSQEAQALNVAFTRAGLSVLGLSDSEVVGFSREFREGMSGNEHRERLLGDVNRSAPSHWRWGGTGETPHATDLHAVLFAFARDQRGLDTVLTELKGSAPDGIHFFAPLETNWLGDKEHFGFHDGIVQPTIDGLKADTGGTARPADIPAGEVILGYRNAYGKIPLSPTVDNNPRSVRYLRKIEIRRDDGWISRPRDFGRNGSYVVIRQLEQDVKAFWENIDGRAERDPQVRTQLAARMVGRWPNGAPLIGHETEEPAKMPQELNDFNYLDDLTGDKCPLGAHIRRTHPRDSLMPDPTESLRVSARHRLVRRGRTYGQPLSTSFDPDEILKSKEDPSPRRGLFFICLNTDVGRQFEFVQSAWVNNPKFNGLYGDPDAVIGPCKKAGRDELQCFTVQAPLRTRHLELKQFVTTVGGCYLFMPGFAAMLYLVADDNPPESMASRS